MDKIEDIQTFQYDHQGILNVIHKAIGVRRHLDVLSWLQGDMQAFLPHDILLAAWGSPGQSAFLVDVVSPHAAVRTHALNGVNITPFVHCLFEKWEALGGTPLQLIEPGGFQLAAQQAGSPINACLRSMRGVLVHAIQNQRDQHICLYAMFRSAPSFPDQSPYHLELLLPHIDTALRRVAHLPTQRPNQLGPLAVTIQDNLSLSTREIEILKWVRAGKTNQEIGMILGISAFTVKNHLQRIFQKLDVTTRAQAVDRLSSHMVRVPLHREATSGLRAH